MAGGTSCVVSAALLALSACGSSTTSEMGAGGRSQNSSGNAGSSAAGSGSGGGAANAGGVSGGGAGGVAGAVGAGGANAGGVSGGGASARGGAASAGAGGVAGAVGAGGANAGGVSGGGASGGGGSSGAGGASDVATVSLDFDPTLSIANETLVFPLTRSPLRRTLSKQQPGDLVVAYTRVGCWVNPEEFIGATAFSPVVVAATAPVRVTGVTVTHVATLTSQPSLGFAAETCVSFRSPGGSWQAFVKSPRATLVGEAVRLEFDVPALEADAAAIFLPTYTSLSNLTYSFRAP